MTPAPDQRGRQPLDMTPIQPEAPARNLLGRRDKPRVPEARRSQKKRKNDKANGQSIHHFDSRRAGADGMAPLANDNANKIVPAGEAQKGRQPMGMTPVADKPAPNSHAPKFDDRQQD